MLSFLAFSAGIWGSPKIGVPPLEVLTKTGPSILQSAAKQQGSDAPGPSTVLEVAGASALGFALEDLGLGFGFGGFCSVFVCGLGLRVAWLRFRFWV